MKDIALPKRKLNSDLLRRVADEIERGEMELDMSVDFFELEGEKPRGCLAAFTMIAAMSRSTALEALRSATTLRDTRDVMEQAARLLGLDEWETEVFIGHEPYDGLERRPFVAHVGGRELRGTRAVNALRDFVPDALRWMADNDTVSWRRAMAAVRQPETV